jgi:hypothetical protein
MLSQIFYQVLYVAWVMQNTGRSKSRSLNLSNRPDKNLYEAKRQKYFRKILVPRHYCVIVKQIDDQTKYCHCYLYFRHEL